MREAAVCAPLALALPTAASAGVERFYVNVKGSDASSERLMRAGKHRPFATIARAQAAKDDYCLRPDSPAWKPGFEPIPVERIGAGRWNE